MQKKDTEVRWQSTMLAKKKLYFAIASLLNDMIVQLHELNDYRTPNIGFFVSMLMAPINLFDSDKNLFVSALKQCLQMQDAHLAETEFVLIPIRPQHQQRQRQNQQIRRRRKLRLLCRSQDWMAVLKRASGKAAGSIFIFNLAVADVAMANELSLATEIVVIFSVSWKEFQKIDGSGCRQHTHKHCTCSAVQVSAQARNASHALGSSHTDCSVTFLRLKRVCHLVSTCLTLCCSLTCRVPRAHLLPRSLFLLPRHQNTHC